MVGSKNIFQIYQVDAYENIVCVTFEFDEPILLVKILFYFNKYAPV